VFMKPRVVQQLGCLLEKQLVQVRHFISTASAVLAGKTPNCDVRNTQLQAPVQELPRFAGTVAVTGFDVYFKALCVTAVAVHDYTDVLGGSASPDCFKQLFFVKPVEGLQQPICDPDRCYLYRTATVTAHSGELT